VGHAAVVKLLLAANNVLVDVQDRYEQKKKPSYLKREKI
jgi:hypothetical protein